MKIKVTEKSYEEVKALPSAPHVKPVKQGAFFRWLLAALSKGELKQTDFTYEEVGMEKLKKDQPCLYLMNHSSFTDLQMISVLLRNRPYHIVCTNDGFIGKEGLMRRLGCIPTKKFVTDLTLVKDMRYVVDTLQESILMYPEASYTFDGTETPLPDSLGKLLKLLKVPVVMIKTDGAFLRDPLYNCLQKRKAKVSAVVEYLLSPEDIREKKPEELNAVLKKAFTYDHFRSQVEKGVEITEDFRADGLHRVLYKCPDCRKEGQLEGKGTRIHCKSCGKEHELLTNGKLKAIKGETAYEFIPDWYRWEREEVRKELQEGSYQLELDVDIYILKDMKSVYKVGEGHLSHNQEGFRLTGCQGTLDYKQSPLASYSLYADYYWYEIGDMISIGDTREQYYCFPKNQADAIVAKARLAQEELYKMKVKEA